MEAYQYLSEVVNANLAEAGKPAEQVLAEESYHGVNSFQGIYWDLAQMTLANKKNEPFYMRSVILDKALDRIDRRLDCADFIIPALFRILKEFSGTSYLLPTDEKRIRNSLISFKYWLDEPGEVHACFFTENHQILYHGAEYLIGGMFPDTVFPNNGMTGAEHKKHGEQFLRRWLTWRSRFGFSEWLTQGYYMEDILGLVNLMCYAPDEDIRQRSRMLIDIMCFDLALHGFRGHLPTTHGRVYTDFIIEPEHEDCSRLMRLLFDEGSQEGLCGAAVMLACCAYQCPEAIRSVYRAGGSYDIRQRVSMDAADAASYGIDGADFDNIMFFWGMQTYSDRVCIDNSLRVFPRWNWMVNRVRAYKERYDMCDEAGVPCPDAPDFTAMTEADIFTRKTPDYILSNVQSFRPGQMGYQQHPWTASLGGRCVIFTTNPATREYQGRPNRWAGNLVLPRSVQYKNVLFCIYRTLPDFVDYLESHLYFPTHEMDEVREEKGFLFGRKGKGYIAVTSLNPGYWEEKDPALFRHVYGCNWNKMYDRAGRYEYTVQGHANVWAIEMGSEAESGSFDAFCASFAENALTGNTLSFAYASPSQGTMTCGWHKALIAEGANIPLRHYKRYDTPFCEAEFDSGEVMIVNSGHTARYDMQTGKAAID